MSNAYVIPEGNVRTITPSVIPSLCAYRPICRPIERVLYTLLQHSLQHAACSEISKNAGMDLLQSCRSIRSAISENSTLESNAFRVDCRPTRDIVPEIEISKMAVGGHLGFGSTVQPEVSSFDLQSPKTLHYIEPNTKSIGLP